MFSSLGRVYSSRSLHHGLHQSQVQLALKVTHDTETPGKTAQRLFQVTLFHLNGGDYNHRPDIIVIVSEGINVQGERLVLQYTRGTRRDSVCIFSFNYQN